MSKVEEFLALVLDGKPIDGYGKRCVTCGQPTDEDDGRKEKLLSLGRAVMRELAKALGVDPKLASVSKAGAAVSGDILLPAPPEMSPVVTYIVFTHRMPRSVYGDFLSRDHNGNNVWHRWEALRDLPALAKKIRGTA